MRPWVDRGTPGDALVERLGLVASAAQQVAEHAPVYREHLVELAASAVVMLAEEVATSAMTRHRM